METTQTLGTKVCKNVISKSHLIDKATVLSVDVYIWHYKFKGLFVLM